MIRESEGITNCTDFAPATSSSLAGEGYERLILLVRAPGYPDS